MLMDGHAREPFAATLKEWELGEIAYACFRLPTYPCIRGKINLQGRQGTREGVRTPPRRCVWVTLEVWDLRF